MTDSSAEAMRLRVGQTLVADQRPPKSLGVRDIAEDEADRSVDVEARQIFGNVLRNLHGVATRARADGIGRQRSVAIAEQIA